MGELAENGEAFDRTRLFLDFPVDPQASVLLADLQPAETEFMGGTQLLDFEESLSRIGSQPVDAT